MYLEPTKLTCSAGLSISHVMGRGPALGSPARGISRARRLQFISSSPLHRVRCSASHQQLQVVFVSSEVAPWSKTGGLADVMGALPAALATRGHRVMVVSPRYANYPGVYDTGLRAPVQLGWWGTTGAGEQPQEGNSSQQEGHSGGSTHEEQQLKAPEKPAKPDPLPKTVLQQHEVRLYACTSDEGVQYVFLDHPLFSTCTPHMLGPEGVYAHTDGAEGVDLQARNSVLCQGALAAPVLLWMGKRQADREEQGQGPPAGAGALGVAHGIARPASMAHLPFSAAWPPRPMQPGPNGTGPASKPARTRRRYQRQHPQPAQPAQAPALQIQAGPVAEAVSAQAPNQALQSQAAAQQHTQQSSPEPQPLQPALPAAAATTVTVTDQDNQVIFVGNDWPTGLLPLWLKAYSERAERQHLPVEQLSSETAASQLAQAAAVLRAVAVSAAEEVLRMVAQTSRRRRGRLKSSGAGGGSEGEQLSGAEELDEGEEEQELEGEAHGRCGVHEEVHGSEASAAEVALQASSSPQLANGLQKPAGTGPPAGRDGILMTGAPVHAAEPPDSQVASGSSAAGAQLVEAAGAATQQPLEGAAAADECEESVHVNKASGNGNNLEGSAASSGDGTGGGMHTAPAASVDEGMLTTSSREESQVNMLIRLAYDKAANKVRQRSSAASRPVMPPGINTSTVCTIGNRNPTDTDVERRFSSMHGSDQAPAQASGEQGTQQLQGAHSLECSGAQQGSHSFVEVHERESQPEAGNATGSESDFCSHVATASSDSEEGDQPPQASEHPNFVTLTAAQLQQYNAVTAQVSAWRPASGNSQAPAQGPPQDLTSGPPPGTDPDWEVQQDWEEEQEERDAGQQGSGGATTHGAAQVQQGREGAVRRSKGRRAVLRTMAEVRQRVEKFQAMLGQRLRGAKVVMAIHNLAHQGLFSLGSFRATGLPQSQRDALLLPTPPDSTITEASEQGQGAAQQPQAQPEGLPEQATQQDQQEQISGGQTGSITQGAQVAMSSSAPKAGEGQGDGMTLTHGQAGSASVASSGTPGDAASNPAPQRLSWLHAAITESDLVLTVSEQYAEDLRAAAQLAACKEAASQEQPPAGVQLLPQEKQGIDSQGTVQRVWVNPSGLVTPRDGAADPNTARLLTSLQQKQVRGILNGIDTYVWSPSADYYLPRSLWYTGKDVHSKKAAAKALLQSRLGLEVGPGAPLVGFVGRLVEQKGADVLLAALPQLLGPAAQGVLNPHSGKRLSAKQAQAASTSFAAPEALDIGSAQGEGRGAAAAAAEEPALLGDMHSEAAPAQHLQVVMLGQGDTWLEQCVQQLSTAWPGRAVGYTGFNEPLAHLIMAACDYLVVPSRSEPCGIVALCAVRYGTLPIVSPAGGLVDVLEIAARSCSPAVAPPPPPPPSTASPSLQAEATYTKPSAQQQQQQAASAGEVDQSSRSAAESLVASSRRPGRHGCGYLLPPMGPAGNALALRVAVDGLTSGVRLAVTDYATANFYALRELCMQQDVSWSQSAQAWEAALLEMQNSACESVPCSDDPSQPA